MTDDLFAAIEAEVPAVREERSAIRQFDAGFTRDEAERLGALDSEAWKTACYVRYFLATPPAKQPGFLQEVANRQGDMAMVPLLRSLPAERLAAALVWVRKTFGPGIAAHVQREISKVAT